MNRLGLSVVLSAAMAAGVFACGGIADPTRGGESIATISGALTGTTVPADARVAVVWRKGKTGGFEVASDAPVVGGKFTLTLATPPSSYFSSLDDEGYGDSISGGSGGGSSSGSYDPVPPAEPEAEPGSSTSGSGGYGGKSLQPQTTVSGEITSPLMAAVAGFVVYVDANGNGKLDIEGSHAGSPDTILGGNRELVLAYLQGGGSLDYEKLRDRSGILPQAGFNLAWERGERWLPLNVVELKISDRQGLPSGVCGGSRYYGEEPNVTPPPSEPAPDMDGGAAPGYPHPDDPNLTCDPDGRGFSYYESYTCPEPEPVPQGLCTRGYDVPSVGCGGGGGWGTRLMDGEPVPPGWPCPVDDGGVLDGGSFDAGVDSGDSDAGAP
jgi:hypothetical protein